MMKKNITPNNITLRSIYAINLKKKKTKCDHLNTVNHYDIKYINTPLHEKENTDRHGTLYDHQAKYTVMKPLEGTVMKKTEEPTKRDHLRRRRQMSHKMKQLLRPFSRSRWKNWDGAIIPYKWEPILVNNINHLILIQANTFLPFSHD